MSKLSVSLTHVLNTVIKNLYNFDAWWTASKHEKSSKGLVWYSSARPRAFARFTKWLILSWVVALKIHDSFGSPRRGPFVDPSPPLFGFRLIFWEALGYINEPTVVLSCSDKHFLLVVQSRGDNQLYLRFRKQFLCRLSGWNICKFVERTCVVFPNLQ